ncbi:MAG: dihydroneopterin aldolase [Oscillospiraceae bacterium]|nr:dihydroneopterin aldolase [Oscillospiraceae bacterium]
MDKIHIAGLEVFAYHGVNPGEKRHGQVFLLDIALKADLSKACGSDNLEDTVNYAQVIKTVAAAFTEQSHDLIEHAAEITAQAVLAGFPLVEAVTLRVHKPDAPVKTPFGDISIEIQRRREHE